MSGRSPPYYSGCRGPTSQVREPPSTSESPLARSQVPLTFNTTLTTAYRTTAVTTAYRTSLHMRGVLQEEEEQAQSSRIAHSAA